MKDARAVIHTDHRGGGEGIEADGGHRAESETKACSRIAVVAFSQVRWYLGTLPPSAKGGGQLESAGYATVAVRFGRSRGLPICPTGVRLLSSTDYTRYAAQPREVKSEETRDIGCQLAEDTRELWICGQLSASLRVDHIPTAPATTVF